MKMIPVGTMVCAKNAAKVIPQLLPYGFECFEINFEKEIGDQDPEKLAKEINAILDGTGAFVSCLSLYANALYPGVYSPKAREDWERLIDCAKLFHTDLITGFTGMAPGLSLPDNIPLYVDVFGRLSEHAARENVKIAFENCSMGGNWRHGEYNIAINPSAWELMFSALPVDNIGLEWEPAHQMDMLIEPIPQLRTWAPKVFHLHGKDVSVNRDVLSTYGINSPQKWRYHRMPGFGDTNWKEITTILMKNAYQGTIDIEGWHDPVFNNKLEYTGQIQALKYLKDCRGGEYVNIEP